MGFLKPIYTKGPLSRLASVTSDCEHWVGAARRRQIGLPNDITILAHLGHETTLDAAARPCLGCGVHPGAR